MCLDSQFKFWIIKVLSFFLTLISFTTYNTNKKSDISASHPEMSTSVPREGNNNVGRTDQESRNNSFTIGNLKRISVKLFKSIFKGSTILTVSELVLIMIVKIVGVFSPNENSKLMVQKICYPLMLAIVVVWAIFKIIITYRSL
ncbi:halotolerance protein HAL2 [Candida tropicalis MYA-3404]|uniref:Halotolerance protein HAL2 n=1 Tax=Candida tropicalis (strain ATCC MYA-3404 / T1) TaxID=294747 RepID=C5M987_CANTT|nr:halotolerance protein HAL2 [Candida tropicalis MYA-3404]EER34142.1 halotolerance protein HAL2 [Candida tropicalis MYA-3404]KAG4408006.1 hypothetical protein JTP64_003542 [Candida tropicalis]